MEEAMPEMEEERGEPMSGFMAFKALGIATAVVCGSAGLGAFVVAKLLGVDSVRPYPSLLPSRYHRYLSGSADK
jgi:hypothetical protein